MLMLETVILYLQEFQVILKKFDLNANPLSDDVPLEGTFTFTGLRVKPGQ